MRGIGKLEDEIFRKRRVNEVNFRAREVSLIFFSRDCFYLRRRRMFVFRHIDLSKNRIKGLINENRIRKLVTSDNMQFGFMPGKGTTYALFILRRMHEVFHGREKKLYICFVNLEKAVDRVPRKVIKWALGKKGLAEVLVQAVMSLYEGSRTKVRVGSGTSDEFGVWVGVHRGSVISPLVFAVVVDVVTAHAREGLLNKILHMDDLVLMSESLEDLRESFQR